MSNKENDVWLEAAWENLNEALVNGNLDMAKAIIADTLNEGFKADAGKMTSALLKATNEGHE